MHLQAMYFDLWNVSQYPLHNVTYAPAKFEVATSNALDADAFTS